MPKRPARQDAYRRGEHRIWNTLRKFDQVMGLQLEQRLRTTRSAEFPAEVLQLRDERERARAAKDFKRADELRDELDARGYAVRDSKSGPVLMAKRQGN